VSRRGTAVLLLAAAVAIGVAAAFLLDARGPADTTAEDAVLARGPSIVVEARIQPRVALFGEPVTAELTAVYDRALVKRSSVSARNDFSPYTLLGREQHTSSDDGKLTRETWRYRLQCLTRQCLPGEARRAIDFEQGQLQYTRLDPGNVLGPGARVARSVSPVDWPSVDVTSRLAPDATQDLVWRAETRALPAVSYRVDPAVATAVLLGGTGLLGGLALLLLAPLGPRRRHAHVDHVVEETAPPLERALLRLEEHRNGDVDDRRRSLELLSRELGVAGHPDLADRARRLAWSREEPSAEESAGLAGTVRAAVAQADVDGVGS
jgi:hypothetical protein